MAIPIALLLSIASTVANEKAKEDDAKRSEAWIAEKDKVARKNELKKYWAARKNVLARTLGIKQGQYDVQGKKMKKMALSVEMIVIL